MDKVVAISGIARATRDQIDDDYVAGMWRRGLEGQLCWYVFNSKSPRPTPYRAPS